MPDSEQILVIKLGALGDIFLALDAFQAIRRHHPAARVTLLTRRPHVSLTRLMPWFDEVWEDPAPRPWQIPTLLRWRSRLTERSWTHVYDLQANDRTNGYFRLMGAARRGIVWMGAAPGCSHPRPPDLLKGISAKERFTRQLALAGIPLVESADLDWLKVSVDHLGINGKFVLLIPGCAPHRPYKRWSAGSYGAVARLFLEDGTGVGIIGTEAEREAVDTILREAPGCLDLCGKTSIQELASLAMRAEAVIGNDTGPVHIAGAVGAPTLVLMSGHSNPKTMLPQGPRVDFRQKENLADLPPEEVLRAARGLTGGK